ncbi:lauroyl acyltransferase [Luteimonas sp. RD2P54]|uniref:Lauroyl acyltransferase n=1 Tax=Luteimonas endophytica TaxID=3042023 RepID=A0ABT6J536_9GAMM|nr:lauroyl acyltransferase [Luteimonas endophytica]MDH5821927.1 lauroyl acyltransferase [Luteimonas endophytica]
MIRAAAALLYAIAAGIGRLPWPALYRIGDGLAWLWRRLDARESFVARRNLEIAYPELLPGQRAAWHREILRTTARQFLETLRFWTRPHAANLALIRQTQGLELFDAALASGRGLIVAAPHYGNWELLNQWLASRTPISVLYRPPDAAIGEAFLRRVRADAGANVTQVRAEGPAAVRQLLRLLKDGGVTGILPDQQPKVGDGEYAPFFGMDALTMTLLGRLAARTGATVLFAYCERIGPEPRFALRIESAPAQIADPDPRAATTALNAAVERIARRDPAQYQWTYKRWRWRPAGSGEPNPYEKAPG